MMQGLQKILTAGGRALALAAVAMTVSLSAAHAQGAPGGPSAQDQALRVVPRHSKVGPAVMSTITGLEARGITRANARERGAAALSTPFVHVRDDGAIQVYLYLSAVGPEELSDLAGYEAEVEVALEQEGLVQAWLPFDRIEAAADLAFVQRVGRPHYAHIRKGSVTTEGDLILKTKKLRSTQGVKGKGVKVGVISAGATSIADSQASGDLPSTVATFGTCNGAVWAPLFCDEGTAMMEIVADLAPRARLGFAAVSSTAEFINGANWLVNTFKADIVVDDIGFFGEPFFEDGAVAKAANNLAKNVVFVSAAGNAAQGHYEKKYVNTVFNGTEPVLNGQNVHNFGKANGGTKDVSMDVVVPNGGSVTVFLQWNDPFGTAGSDYDLFILDQADTTLLCLPSSCGTNIQSVTKTPLEAARYVNLTGSPRTVHVVVNKFSGSAKQLEMFILGNSVPQYNKKKGSVFGHPAAKRVFAVGAISALDPNNDDIQPFSSRGPSKIFFPSKQARKKPDISGIDTVTTTGPGAFPVVFPRHLGRCTAHCGAGGAAPGAQAQPDTGPDQAGDQGRCP